MLGGNCLRPIPRSSLGSLSSIPAPPLKLHPRISPRPASMSGGPTSFPDQKKHPVAGLRFLEGRNVPVIALTALTAGSMFVWWYRKSKHDPIILADSARRTSGLPEEGLGRELAQHSEAYAKEGYGRKSAEGAGLMEGDRAMQGIFPAKKIVETMDKAGLMPETAISKELKEKEAGK